jgi:tetratricopeptide (TPR) repeat protein
MNNLPDYIYKKFKAIESTDDMEKSRQVLAFELEDEADRGFLYALSTVLMRDIAPPQEVIDKCETYLPLVTRRDPRHALQCYRIWAYQDLKDHDKAISLQLEQVAEYPDGGSTQLKIAENYKEREDTDNAIKYYEEYMTLSGDSVDTDEYVALAELYETQNDFKNSAKYYQKAAAWEARFSADYWQKTGRALALDEQEDEAMFYFKFALKINPKDAYTHYYMGRVYQNKQDKYRALHHYTEALKINPDFAEVHLNIGAMEFDQEGDVKTAIACFERAIDSKADDKLLKILYNNLKNMYKIILDHEKSDYYRGKLYELVGLPADTGEFLDEVKRLIEENDNAAYNDNDDEDEDDDSDDLIQEK